MKLTITRRQLLAIDVMLGTGQVQASTRIPVEDGYLSQEELYDLQHRLRDAINPIKEVEVEVEVVDG
jgi:hypothetical protein